MTTPERTQTSRGGGKRAAVMITKDLYDEVVELASSDQRTIQITVERLLLAGLAALDEAGQ